MSDGSGPSRGPKRFSADHNGATRVHGVSARTTAEPPSRDLDGDAHMSSGSEGSPALDSDSDEVPGVSPRAASLGSASGPAPRPAPCPVGRGRAALPAFGWLRGQATGAFPPPRLHTCPGLRIAFEARTRPIVFAKRRTDRPLPYGSTVADCPWHCGCPSQPTQPSMASRPSKASRPPGLFCQVSQLSTVKEEEELAQGSGDPWRKACYLCDPSWTGWTCRRCGVTWRAPHRPRQLIRSGQILKSAVY